MLSIRFDIRIEKRMAVYLLHELFGEGKEAFGGRERKGKREVWCEVDAKNGRKDYKFFLSYPI